MFDRITEWLRPIDDKYGLALSIIAFGVSIIALIIVVT